MASREEMRRAQVKAIDELLQAGTIPWRKQWVGRGGMPTNPQTKREFHGWNRFILFLQGETYWATYRQWKKIGGQVQKGEKGTEVWRPVFRTFDKGTPNERRIPVTFISYKVFSAAQQVGWVAPAVETPAVDLTPIEAAEAIIANMPNRPTMNHNGGDRAYYVPALDKVELPERDQFTSVEGYYSVVFHELSHSTGHVSRCNRDEFGDFSKHAYSKEELVAEFSAMFLNAECGIAPAVVENSAAYIATWRKRLHDTPEMIDGVITLAEKSADYILGVKASDKGDDADADAA